MIHRYLAGLVIALAVAEPVMGETLLVSASTVRLRSSAGTDAPILRMLSLGSELETLEVERVEGWLPVRVPGTDGEQGWVDASLTVAVTPETWPQVVTALISERTQRPGEDFQSMAELVELIESVSRHAWDAEAAARLELQKLQALKAAMDSAGRFPSLARDSRFQSWLQKRADLMIYNDPGGQWLLRNDAVLTAHDAHRGTDAADEIAWLAVQVSLPGECEGELVCYLQRADKLQGEYLRREPSGRHVEAAAQRIHDLAKRALASLASTQVPPQYFFDPQHECDGMRVVNQALDSAVRGSSALQREAVSARLAELLMHCR